MAKDSQVTPPEGYSPLLLSIGTTEFLYVPTPLAQSIKSERRRQAEAPVNEPAAPKEAHVATPVKARRRRPVAPSRLVAVLDYAALLERRVSIGSRIRFGYEEKKTETRVLDELIERGEQRVVGLRRDWRRAIEQMRSEMPHMARVIERIGACCALAEFAGQPLRIPPLLLVGPPGVGKTRFATSVAQMLGVPSYVYALESAETTSVLTGAEKYWSNSETGELFKLIVMGQFANPVIVLDELDKACNGSRQYRPADALHAVLETSTAKGTRDKSFDLRFDASYAVYIATANVLSDIKASLLSRFELFLIDEPEPRAAVAIARAVGQDVLRELKLTKRFGAPAGEVVQQLALLGSPRRMHKVLAAAVGRAIVAGRTGVDVEDLLGDATKAAPADLSLGGREEPLH